MGHALIKNRNGLIVDSRLPEATGSEGRGVDLDLPEDIPGTKQIILDADKGDDAAVFLSSDCVGYA